jgi:hypothetical protein
MNFKPQTEREIAEGKLLAAGAYDFEIVGAVDKPSKRKGKPMIELKLRIGDGRGGSRIVFDYLLEETPLKLRRAAEICGLLARYNTGALPAALFLGKRGKLKLGIEKDKSKNYPDKNFVEDYIGAVSGRMLLLNAAGH